MKLVFQKFRTSGSHTVQLEETQCGQQWLNVFFANFDTRRVRKLDKKLQGCRIDTIDPTPIKVSKSMGFCSLEKRRTSLKLIFLSRSLPDGDRTLETSLETRLCQHCARAAFSGFFKMAAQWGAAFSGKEEEEPVTVSNYWLVFLTALLVTLSHLISESQLYKSWVERIFVDFSLCRSRRSVL